MKSALALLASLAWVPPRADVSVFVGASGAAGDVLVLDPFGREEWPARLQGIVLLPFDVQGRTRLDELRPDRPRLGLDLPGAVRVRLPHGQGGLYRYRRDVPGGAVFGFFVIDAAGRARSVLETPGTGTYGLDDPLATRVSVNPRGDAILIGTSLAADGDLLEVDLQSARVTNRTEDLPPLRFRKQGIRLLSSWGVAVAEDGPLRFAVAQSASAVPVPGPWPWPPWFGDDVVCSADEAHVAFVAGAGPAQAHVYAFGPSGEAVRVTEAACHLSGGGFQPEEPAGPTLALSTDGSYVAWRTEGLQRECWVRSTAAAPSEPDTQITRDDNFEDTLNDTGVIAFYERAELTLLIGEDEGRGLEHADLFRVQIAPSGALTITDLSRTNDRDERPFGYGRLALADGLFRLPGPSSWLVRDPGLHDDESALTWIDAMRDRRVSLLDRVGPLGPRGVDWDMLVASVPGSSASLPHRLLRLRLADLDRCTWSLPAEIELTRFSILPSGLATVFTRSGGELLGRIGSECDRGVLLSNDPAEFGPTIVCSAGTVHATVRMLGQWVVLAWSGVRAIVLRAGLGPCFLLPGDG